MLHKECLCVQSGASVRVVNQLLTEMDGLETRRQVFIMAATNRPGTYPASVRREPLRVTGDMLKPAWFVRLGEQLEELCFSSSLQQEGTVAK